ncbi:MAG: diguanylate cyclase (GGDEF)-like protein/PAS domain S-box-containing protein [Glaciecola sp.]|jgi:diguanylate cyclase (GGDEF)-like protein/PAS domain S-box-containing protein
MNKFNGIDFIEFANNAPIGIVIHDLQSFIFYANPTAMSLLDTDSSQTIGQVACHSQWHFIDEFGIKIPESSHPACRVSASSEPIRNEVIGLIYGAECLTKWFSISAYLHSQPEDEDMVVVTYTDITLKKNEALLQDIVENATDTVIITEAHTIDVPLGPNIIYVNRAFESLTGYKAQEIIGKTPRILQGTETNKATLLRIKNSLEKNQAIQESVLNYDKNGRPYWVEMNIIPLTNKFGKVTHFAAIQRDVTKQQFHEEQLEKRNTELKQLKESLQQIVDSRTAQLQSINLKLEQLACYDYLTKLPNRRSFQDCFKRQLSQAKRHNKLFLIGVIDLDNFKIVNDKYGHEFGDQVLTLAANSIMEVLRVEDCAGRIGGEEFAFSGVIEQHSDIEHLCQRMLESISGKQLETDFGEFISITASIGVYALIPDENASWIDLYRRADSALYEVKASGKNSYKEYVGKGSK